MRAWRWIADRVLADVRRRAYAAGKKDAFETFKAMLSDVKKPPA